MLTLLLSFDSNDCYAAGTLHIAGGSSIVEGQMCNFGQQLLILTGIMQSRLTFHTAQTELQSLAHPSSRWEPGPGTTP